MKERIKEILLALPRLGLLISKLMTDPRVSPRTKVTLAAMGVYLASPWDIIPDFIPVFGQLDDLTVLLLLLDGVLNQIDEEILFDHWRGDLRTLHTLQNIAWVASFWVPARVKKFFFAHLESEAQRRDRDSFRESTEKPPVQ